MCVSLIYIPRIKSLSQILHHRNASRYHRRSLIGHRCRIRHAPSCEEANLLEALYLVFPPSKLRCIHFVVNVDFGDRGCLKYRKSHLKRETIPSSSETTLASSEPPLSSTSATSTADTTTSSITEPDTTTATVTSLSSSETPITITTPPSATSTAISIVTTTSTTTAPSGPIINNGDFETRSREGWTSSQVGGGYANVVFYGNSWVLDLYTSYFIRSTAAQAVVNTQLNCVADTRYRLNIDLSVVSPYTNGNAWSITVGTTTIASGPGSLQARRTVTYDFNCVDNPAVDIISVRKQSGAAREGHLYIDNAIVTPLGVAS